MSAYHQIFIHTEQPLETFLADLAAVCGKELTKVDQDPVDYAGSLGTAALDLLLKHDFEEDEGIPFERYEWLIEIRDYERDYERQETAAYRVFEALERTGRYALLLVFDLQDLLASSPPLPSL